MKIGILGGTFDPIHKGHLTLAREAVRQFNLDKVFFIPAHIPPHKKENRKFTPGSYRARMTELAILGEPKWEFSDMELRRQGISYTVDTLREFRKLYPPPDELYFIAGADSLEHLNEWKDPKEILKLSQWIVAPRPDSKMPVPLPSGVHLLNMPPLSVSGSELRQKINRGEDVSSYIPLRVCEYIRRSKIYEGEIK